MKKIKLKKIKCKRIFAFSAVLIVLFAFLVIPAGATSIITYSSTESSQDVPSMSCPVPIDISFDIVNRSHVENSLVRAGGPESDQIYDYYYGFSSSLSSIAYLNDFSSSYSVTVTDSLPRNYVWSGVISPVSSSLEFFDLYSDLDDDVAFIGSCEFSYENFKVSNSWDSSSSDPVVPFSYCPDSNVDLTLSDFYMWNQTFDDRITTNSEISLTFDYGTSKIRPYSFEFFYSLAGYSTVNYLYVSALDFNSSAENYFDIYTFSPSILGIDDPEAVVYVHQCVVSFGSKYLSGLDSTLPELIFNIGATYTFNPYLDNYAVSPPEIPDVDPDNPAIALSRYTEWIGDALGGFLDFNIFPGFTLGGIFMTLLAFSCVVWFLKLVAGG